jgi:ElaB/YqjD/DUF883 family membrane-anchored ribosome-binding protein
MERDTATPTTKTSTTTTQGSQGFLREEEGQRLEGGERGGAPVERAGEILEEGARNISSAAQRVAERTREVAGTVKNRASEIGSRVADRTDAAMSAAGERIEHLGQSLRERSSEEGRFGRVMGRTAQALEQSGLYLQESTPTDVRMDLEDVMRKRPIATLLVGAGLGFLIARALRRE